MGATPVQHPSSYLFATDATDDNKYLQDGEIPQITASIDAMKDYLLHGADIVRDTPPDEYQPTPCNWLQFMDGKDPQLNLWGAEHFAAWYWWWLCAEYKFDGQDLRLPQWDVLCTTMQAVIFIRGKQGTFDYLMGIFKFYRMIKGIASWMSDPLTLDEKSPIHKTVKKEVTRLSALSDEQVRQEQSARAKQKKKEEAKAHKEALQKVQHAAAY